MRVGISGASGYLGTELCAYFEKNGHEVVRLSRRQPKDPKQKWIRFGLGEAPSAASLSDLDALIHAAYDFSLTKWQDIESINTRGSIALLAAAEEAKVQKIIYVSTISAYDGCRSMYGKAKLIVERWGESRGVFAVRPGLVYGSEPQGVFGSILKVVGKSPIVPLIGLGRYPQYLVHVDDLCRLLCDIASGKLVPAAKKPIFAAFPKSIRFREIILVIAHSLGKKIYLLPVPPALVFWGIRAFEIIGIKVNFRADSVVSLCNQNPAPDFASQSEIESYFREFKRSTIN